MVRMCYVCKLYSYDPEAIHLSFHRFPVNPERRNIWLSALGFEADHRFPKVVEICSNHFQQNDFAYREDGTRYLKRETVPVPTHSIFCRRESTSSEFSTDTESECDAIATGTSPQLSSLEDIDTQKRLKKEPDESDIFCTPGPSNRIEPTVKMELNTINSIKEEPFEVNHEIEQPNSEEKFFLTNNYEGNNFTEPTLKMEFNAINSIKAEPFDEEDLKTVFKNETNTPDNIEEVLIKHEEVEIKTENDLNTIETSDLSVLPEKINKSPTYKCNFCSYTSRRKSSISRHEEMHEEDVTKKKFKCNICGHLTKWRGALYKHKLTHKKSSKIIWYECELCPFMTKLKSRIKIHMLTHKNMDENKMGPKLKRGRKKNISSEINDTSDKLKVSDISLNQKKRNISKRRSFSFAEKQKIIEELKILSKNQIYEKYNLDPSVFHRWLEDSSKIKSYASENYERTLKRHRNLINKDLEDMVYTWFLETRSCNIPINGSMIKQKAEEIAKDLNILDFRASDRWLYGWRRRKTIGELTVSGEKLSADQDAADVCKKDG